MMMWRKQTRDPQQPERRYGNCHHDIIAESGDDFEGGHRDIRLLKDSGFSPSCSSWCSEDWAHRSIMHHGAMQRT